ncbi:hypothetical protein ABW20_dc0105859 [Dactylellina cionopaga]|nr:hypothetical protein ABW20_dc0105859 [Dactylellina cionopaga]
MLFLKTFLQVAVITRAVHGLLPIARGSYIRRHDTETPAPTCTNSAEIITVTCRVTCVTDLPTITLTSVETTAYTTTLPPVTVTSVETTAYTTTLPPVTVTSVATTILPPTTCIPTGPSPFPDTSCNNTGVEIGLFSHPYANTGPSHEYPVQVLDATYFKTRTPINTTTSNVVGCDGGCFNLDGLQGPGTFSYLISYVWRGFFYAPVTATYVFSITGANDFGALWTNQTAISGYNNGNPRIWAVGLGPPYPSGSYSVTIPGGTYFPLRMQYADGYGGGLYWFTVTDTAGNVYVPKLAESKYLVQAPCDSSIRRFDPFGQET